MQPMGRHGAVYGRKVLLYYPEQPLYYPQTTVQGAVQQVPCLIIMGFDGAFQITALMAYAINSAEAGVSPMGPNYLENGVYMTLISQCLVASRGWKLGERTWRADRTNALFFPLKSWGVMDVDMPEMLLFAIPLSGLGQIY